MDRNTKTIEDNAELRWLKILHGIGLRNKFKETFSMNSIKEQDYGFKCKIQIPAGVEFSQLLKHKKSIEDSFPCYLEFNKTRLSNEIDMNIITSPLNDVCYKNVECDSNEIFVGTRLDGSSYTLDQTINAHLQILGLNGYGKTKLIENILTNLIRNSKEKDDVEIHINQHTKTDLFVFSKCDKVANINTNIEETLEDMESIIYELKKREDILSRARLIGEASTIEEYNIKHSSNPIKYLYVVLDEYSEFNEKDKKQQSTQLVSMLNYILQTGRSLGCFIILTSSNSAKSKISSNINHTIVFKQNDNSFSKKVKGVDAVNLERREAEIIISNEFICRIKVPYISLENILESF